MKIKVPTYARIIPITNEASFVIGIILAYVGTFIFKGSFNYLFEIPHNKGISTADFWNKGVDWIFDTFFVYIKAFNTWLIQDVLQLKHILN